MDAKGGPIRRKPVVNAGDLALLRVLLGSKVEQQPAPTTAPKARKKIRRLPDLRGSGKKGVGKLAKRRRKIAKASRRRNRGK